MKNKLIMLFAIATLMASTSFAGLLDKKVDLSTLPSVVQETIKQHAQGGKIESIEEEGKKDGLKVYEVEVKKADGKEIEFKVDENGKLIEFEKD